MFGISTNNLAKPEYIALEKKMSEIDTKISRLFDNMVAALFAGAIIMTVMLIGGVVTPLLAIATCTFAETAFYATLYKSSLTFLVAFQVIGGAIMLTAALKCKSIITKNNTP